LVIVEWKSNYVWTFPLRTKKDGQRYLILWMRKYLSVFGTPLGHIHIDNGELRQADVTNYCNGLGVVLHGDDRIQPEWIRAVPGHGSQTQVDAIIPKAHHQNSRVEREIRTVTEGIFAATRHGGAEDNLWDFTQVGYCKARNLVPRSKHLLQSLKHLNYHNVYKAAKAELEKARTTDKGGDHSLLEGKTRQLRAEADSELESATYAHHGNGRPMSPFEIFNQVPPRGRDDPETTYIDYLKEIYPPFVEVIGSVRGTDTGVSHPKVAPKGYWGIYLCPTDPCFDKRTDGVLQKGHLILTAAGIVRRCWHLSVRYGSYPLRHRTAHLQRSPLDQPIEAGTAPDLATIFSKRGLGEVDESFGEISPVLQTDPIALDLALGPDYANIDPKEVDRIVTTGAINPEDRSDFTFPPVTEDLDVALTLGPPQPYSDTDRGDLPLPTLGVSNNPHRMTQRERMESWAARDTGAPASQIPSGISPEVSEEKHDETVDASDSNGEGEKLERNPAPTAPRRSTRTRKAVLDKVALDGPELFAPGTAVETTKGTAIYMGMSRGNRVQVRLLTSASPEAIHSMISDNVWLPDDRPHRYNSQGLLLTTTVDHVAPLTLPTPHKGGSADTVFVDYVSPASWESCYHVHVADHPVPLYSASASPSPRRRTYASRFTTADVQRLHTLSSSLVESDLPARHHQTLYHPLRSHIAMGERRELQDMLEIPVCDPPVSLQSLPDIKVIPTMWVYTVKPNDFGLYLRMKARLTMMGNKERLTLSKLDATAPVANPTTIRILIVLHIGDPGVTFHTIDVSQAYLSTEMKRTVYIGHPPGYRIWHTEKFGLQYSLLAKGERAPLTAMKLRRALYGGMECGRLFFDKYVQVHVDMGFTQTHYERCLLILLKDNGDFIKIVFHVDDGLVAWKGANLWAWYQAEFGKAFKFTLKDFTRFLGVDVKVDYNAQTVELNLEKQIVKFLRAFDLEDCNGSSYGPMPSNYQIPTAADIPEDPQELESITSSFDMQSCVDHLGFLQHIGRPDLSLVLKILSTATVKFGKAHIELARHAMRYLQATKHVTLVLRAGFARELQIYTDASHASHPDHRKSITGVVVKLCGCTIYWCCLYQKIVSHSSCESELIALDKGATIGHLLARLTGIIGAPQTQPISIFVDSQSAIDITSGNPIQPGRNLHVHARYFFVRDCVIDKTYEVHHLPSSEQLADILCVFKSSATFKHLFKLLMGCCRVEIDPKSGAYAWNTALLHIP